MSEYKGIRGFKVQTLSTDPAASKYAGATWASGGNLPTALSSVRGLGPQTAAVAVGGITLPGPASNATFHYDGSTWSTPPATLNTARGFANISKLGTQTAGIYFGGSPYLGNNESYNGTSWTEVADLNTARQELGGSGTQTAALATGGRTSSPAYVGNNESWNGTSWTEVNDLNTARGNLDSTGTSTDSIAGGGTIAPASPTVGVNAETWNGTSWTTITSFSTARRANSMLGLTSTDAIVVGGDISNNPFPTQTLTGATEYWNGSTWTELNDLATGRANAGSSGSSTAGLIEGGYGPPASYLTATEEFTAPSVFQQQNLGQVYYNSTANAFKVTKQSVPAGSWSAGGNTNTARGQAGAAGDSITTGLVFGGFTGPTPPQETVNTESYNGTSWAEVNNLNTARRMAAGAGTQTSALMSAGYTPGGNVTNVESWNGTSWTETTDVNTARYGLGGAGASNTSQLIFGGYSPLGERALTESWNGTSWTEVNDLNTAGYAGASLGIQTAAIYAGRTVTAIVESWDGTSWTEVNDLNVARNSFAGAGTTTSGLVFGGNVPPISALTEFYNGTSWTELSDLATARDANTGSGSSVSALTTGNETGGVISTTEEWTGATLNSTITVS